MEGDLTIGRGEPREARNRQPGAGIAVAEHFDVSAERDRAEFPACPRPIPPAEHLRTKTDREDFDPNPVPAGDQIMTEFMNENENSQNDQKRDDVGEPVVEEFDHHQSVLAAPRTELRRPESPAAISRAVVSKL